MPGSPQPDMDIKWCEPNATEPGHWLVPVLLVLLTAGSFYYYAQKVETQIRLERQVARAEMRRDIVAAPTLRVTAATATRASHKRETGTEN